MKSLNNAIDVIKKRIANLLPTNESETKTDEIKELEALVPEIIEKINDIKEFKEEEERSKKTKTEDCQLSGNDTNFSSGSILSKNAEPISSNLIKKKQTEGSTEAPEATKQRS